MTRTITALFDTRQDAEAAENRLKAANVDAGHIAIHDKASPGFHATGHSTTQDVGIWASVKNAFLPDEDRHTYEEGVRRGGFLLTADVGEEHVDEAVRALEEAQTVDIDERAQQWRSSGWDYAPGATTGADANADALAYRADQDSLIGDSLGGDTFRDDAMRDDAMRDDTRGNDDGHGADLRARDGVGEQSIPIVEEQLIVGKREVERGGARVRSYVTEVPVHEQVRLRDERVDVQRRAVDRPVSDADDAFRERTIEVTATGEEAVVSKTARVVEEVVVSKTADERVEQIDDTVRRTDVEIDGDRGTATDRVERR